jgi:predicted nucleotidyltransferase
VGKNTIPEEFKLPLIDFADKVSKITDLKGIILFGSVVTGDMSKKSDIDLLLIFDTDHNPEIGEEAKLIQQTASEISSKYDLAIPFSFVFINKKDINEVDSDFLWNVTKEGVVIWGNPQYILMKTPHPSLEPMILIRYSVKELNERNKRKLLRWLYTSKKNIIDESKEKWGPGVLLIKAKKYDEIKFLFDEFKVKYSVKKIWGN